MLSNTHLNLRLKEKSFLKVLMSGSGSTFFGLCRGSDEAAQLAEELAGEFAESAEVYAVHSLSGLA